MTTMRMDCRGVPLLDEITYQVNGAYGRILWILFSGMICLTPIILGLTHQEDWTVPTLGVVILKVLTFACNGIWTQAEDLGEDTVCRFWGIAALTTLTVCAVADFHGI